MAAVVVVAGHSMQAWQETAVRQCADHLPHPTAVVATVEEVLVQLVLVLVLQWIRLVWPDGCVR